MISPDYKGMCRLSQFRGRAKHRARNIETNLFDRDSMNFFVHFHAQEKKSLDIEILLGNIKTLEFLT
jgi:hypothetical protein